MLTNAVSGVLSSSSVPDELDDSLVFWRLACFNPDAIVAGECNVVPQTGWTAEAMTDERRFVTEENELQQ
jgi:hypothetical protein